VDFDSLCGEAEAGIHVAWAAHEGTVSLIIAVDQLEGIPAISSALRNVRVAGMVLVDGFAVTCYLRGRELTRRSLW
jgi:hypothetical protein